MRSLIFKYTQNFLIDLNGLYLLDSFQFLHKKTCSHVSYYYPTFCTVPLFLLRLEDLHFFLYTF